MPSQLSFSNVNKVEIFGSRCDFYQKSSKSNDVWLHSHFDGNSSFGIPRNSTVDLSSIKPIPLETSENVKKAINTAVKEKLTIVLYPLNDCIGWSVFSVNGKYYVSNKETKTFDTPWVWDSSFKSADSV